MSFDLTNTANDFLGRIGAVTFADCADWLTEDEVFTYFDEAAQRLAELGLFVASQAFPVTAGAAQYPMPANWIDSLHVDVDGQQLRPTSTAELEALDSAWPQETCDDNQLPSRYSMDAASLGTITLYPVPSDASDTLTSVSHVSPATLAAATPLAPIPAVVSDYFLYFALQRARGKESPNQMPEIAAAAAEQCALYEQIFASYWGNVEP
jgi:hypothetical protein